MEHSVYQEQKSSVAPGHRDSEQLLCTSLELAPCPCWLASHLLSETSLQVAAWWPVGVREPGWGCHRIWPGIQDPLPSTGCGTLASPLPSPSLSFLICETQAVRTGQDERMRASCPARGSYCCRGHELSRAVAVMRLRLTGLRSKPCRWRGHKSMRGLGTEHGLQTGLFHPGTWEGVPVLCTESNCSYTL